MIVIDLAKRQLAVLNDLIDETTHRLNTYKTMPDKVLTCRSRSGNNQNSYYYEEQYSNGKVTLDPLGKSENKNVIAYKRRRYLKKLLKTLEANKAALEQFISSFKDYSPEAIQKNLPNIARDGTPFRSKGECMWYDNILFEGLPVRIEPELELMGESGQWHKLFPDFMFKCFDGSVILVEHFGKWDDEKYAERNKRKIQEYLDCGFVLGDNLIVTSDNAEHCTNELMMVEALEKIKKRIAK